MGGGGDSSGAEGASGSGCTTCSCSPDNAGGISQICGAPAAVVTVAPPKPAASMWLEANVVGLYHLTDTAKTVFAGVFTHPPVATTIRFGWSGPGNSGITLLGVITLDIADWNKGNEESHIQLLGHEHTHLPQWAALGKVAFLQRYLSEYKRADNYTPPPALIATAITALEPNFTDASYTLDQMAERTGNEAVTVAKAKGYIP